MVLPVVAAGTRGFLSDRRGNLTPVASSSDRLRELVEHAVRAGQPAAALRAMTALREELDAFERLQVARALDAGQSFGDVARAIGISRQAAHRRYRDLAGRRAARRGGRARGRPPAARDQRGARRGHARARGGVRDGRRHGRQRAPAARASSAAARRARRRCSSRAASRSPTRAAARSRRSSRARPPVRPSPPPGAAAGPRGISAYARAVFELALREASKRGDGYVGVDHLLLASLEDPNGGACRTLCELGLDPEQVRSGVAA